MAKGYEKTSGEIQKFFANEVELWERFNYVFSDSCRKTSTYKYAFIKAILDNLLLAQPSLKGLELSYLLLFSKFAENYWNIVIKHDLKQMRHNGTSKITKLEKVFFSISDKSAISSRIDFECLSSGDRDIIIKEIARECKRYVVGALYEDFNGILYGFDLIQNGIWINPVAYEFMLKYKMEIEKLNYYSWARFLEKISENQSSKQVLINLDKSTPRRKNLNIFRQILHEEFEQDNCFYCGTKLNRNIHVDHAIPWSFVKTDNLWNFVLACPKCNAKKNNLLPDRTKMSRIVLRNELFLQSQNVFVKDQCSGYSADLIWSLWGYAKMSGFRIADV